MTVYTIFHTLPSAQETVATLETYIAHDLIKSHFPTVHLNLVVKSIFHFQARHRQEPNRAGSVPRVAAV